MTTSPSGTGVGVNLTQVPASNTDLFANAQTENAKRSLALIADSLKSADVSFVEHRPFKYDNHTNRPALSHPMVQIRIPVDADKPSAEAWQLKYEELVSQLPEEIQNWLKNQVGLSFYLRDLEFFAFHAFLSTVADGLVWLDLAARPIPLNSVVLERAEENLNLPNRASLAAIIQDKEILARGSEMWEELGRNNPYFDKNKDYFAQTEAHLKELEEVIQELAKEAPNAMKQLNELSKKIELLKTTYNSTSAGNDLQILKYVIDTLSLTTSSLLLGYGPASVLWLFTPSLENHTPTHLQQAIENFTSGISSNTAQKQLLHDSLRVLFMGTLATTLGIAERGLNAHPNLDNESDKAVRAMTLTLGSLFLIHSDILANTYRNLAKVVTANEETQKLIEQGATFANLGLLLLSLGDELSETLFHSLHHALLPLATQLSEQLEKVPQAMPEKVYLQQAKIALENDNYKGFKQAYEGILETLSLSSKDLQKDFEEINLISTLIKEAVNKGLGEVASRATTMQAI